MTREELERTVLSYYDDILRYCVCRIRSRTAAEDAAQETFLRFFRYAADGERFSSERPLKAYLYTIASNVCRTGWAEITEETELDENLPAPGEERELSYVIEAAMSSLPDAQREAAVLYYWGGLRVREIARIQCATVSAVKSRLKAARDTLRTILTEEGIS